MGIAPINWPYGDMKIGLHGKLHFMRRVLPLDPSL